MKKLFTTLVASAALMVATSVGIAPTNKSDSVNWGGANQGGQASVNWGAPGQESVNWGFHTPSKSQASVNWGAPVQESVNWG